MKKNSSVNIKTENNFECPPVLILAFRRPDNLKKLLGVLRKIKPKILFISSDGPRPGHQEEYLAVKEVRKLIASIDWRCKIKKRYSNDNLGIIKGALGGIQWFFDNVERGIVFDDDCIPDESFFKFCAEMLEKYKDNQRIMHICGYNFDNGNKDSNDSYYFSKYTYMWGWASWKRAWKKYDFNMNGYSTLRDKSIMKNISADFFERNYLKRTLDNAFYKNKNAVDTRWLFSVIREKGLTVVPNINLVENIGFTEGSTNTKQIDSFMAFKSKKMIFPLNHPHKIALDRNADKRYGRWLFQNKIKKHFLLITGLSKIITSSLKHKK